jgi:hypothetical protein
MMTSINSYGDITTLDSKSPQQRNILIADQQKSGRTDTGVKVVSEFPPEVIADSLGHLLKNLQIVRQLKDTTGVILEEMKAQMEGRGIKVVDMTLEAANAKSQQASENISKQNDLSLVQINRDFLRHFQE